MTGFLAIARREIRERRVLLVAVALASLGAAAVPLFQSFKGASAPQVRGLLAFFASFVFAAGIAISLGATALAPGIATRRIGFDLARPLSALAIWGGRIAGAAGLAVAAVLITWIPALIAGVEAPWNDVLPAANPPRAWPLLALFGFAVLFAIVLCTALAVRSRSGLIVLDAALALLSAFLVAAAFSRLPVYRAEAPFQRVAIGLTVAAGAAFLAAGYASVVRGRTDVRASHRALSSVLWPVIGVAVIAANAYAAWVSAAKPLDLRQGFWVGPAASGPWVTLSGPARGAEAKFVYDTAAGRSERTLTADWRGPILSRDGKRAVWIQAERHGPYPLWTWRLDVTGARPVRTGLLLNSYPYLMVLSDDGSRLATWEAGTLSVYDVAQEQVLASARVASGDRQSLGGTFASRDVFRIYRADDLAVDLLQLDLHSRALETLGRIEGLEALRSYIVDAQGERVLTMDGRNHGVRLFSCAGVLVASLADAPAESRWPGFLADGRIVLSERSSTGRRLRVFAPDGREGSAIALEPASSISLGGEVAPGLLSIGVTDERFRSTAWLVDLNAGTLRKVADDLRPVAVLRTAVGPGSDATKLFYGPEQRSLVRFDPLTGERRVILAGERP